MDLRPTENYLLSYSATRKYKAEVKGATLVPSCTFLPYAGMTTRTLHPHFSNTNYLLFARTFGLLWRASCVIGEFLPYHVPRELSAFPTVFAAQHRPLLSGYSPQGRLLFRAHEALLLQTAIAAPRLILPASLFRMNIAVHSKALGQVSLTHRPRMSTASRHRLLNRSSPRYRLSSFQGSLWLL